jgi:hypothetical protein
VGSQQIEPKANGILWVSRGEENPSITAQVFDASMVAWVSSKSSLCPMNQHNQANQAAIPFTIKAIDCLDCAKAKKSFASKCFSRISTANFTAS